MDIEMRFFSMKALTFRRFTEIRQPMHPTVGFLSMESTCLKMLRTLMRCQESGLTPSGIWVTVKRFFFSPDYPNGNVEKLVRDVNEKRSRRRVLNFTF